MRKWMRERMKRRKKEPEKTQAGDQKPAPLQPDFYGEATTSRPVAQEKETQPELPESREMEHVAPSQTSAQRQTRDPLPTPARTDEPARRRRRRGRGGRGRGSGQRGQSAAQPAGLSEPTRAVAEDLEMPAPAGGAPAKSAAAALPVSRVPRGTVVLAIGLPGSGKSSWFKRHDVTPLSSDLLRSLLFDDPKEQRFQDLVFSNLRSMLKARLIARRPMNYVDATNLTPHERHSWIKLAKDFNYDVQALFFDVPVEVCIERNQRRERVVADDVMRRMAAKLRAPTFEEGFSKITVVRVKKKESGGDVESENR